MRPLSLDCFTGYDVRGRLGVTLDGPIAYRIGRAFAQVVGPGQVVSGRDNRPSSPDLQAVLQEGLRDGGADVIDIGLCGSEEVYFATDHLGAGGGLMVTGSHNPITDNGIKLVQGGARPLPDGVWGAIRRLAGRAGFASARRGAYRRAAPRAAYVTRVLSFIDPARLRPLRLLVNAGHGAAGPAFDAIAARLAAQGAPLEFITLHHAPDSRFPQGIPNPLLPENRAVTAAAVGAAGADFGVAWDGDFDRCFFFDGAGQFIAGEYIVALLAARLLARAPGARIIHDPRVIWNLQHVVRESGGVAVVSRPGHGWIKARMRAVDGLYGGEMSAHHYFRDFMYCDSGMIPWLLVAEHLSETGQSLGDLVAQMGAAFPSSGEINFTLADPAAALARVEAVFGPRALSREREGGLSMGFARWRFNLRRSETEPLLRLNMESRGDRALLAAKLAELRAVIDAGAGEGGA